jgi:hypothetical protein
LRVRKETALSKYLSDLVHNFQVLHKSKFLDLDYRRLVVDGCTRVMETSTRCLSLAVKRGDSAQGGELRASMRFFFKGESPDLSSEELGTQMDRTLIKEIRRTTVLHEAVFSCCYAAVECFVLRSTIPLMVRDCNETALDLPLRLKRMVENKFPEDWRLKQLNLIIGLVARTSKVDITPDLPLGWEKVELGEDLIGLKESTVNPGNPSLTFEEPKFSLLQETQITLGSRRAAEGGLTYKFDLVRFIHSSRIADREGTSLIYDESWYRNDIQEHESQSQSLLILVTEEFMKENRFRSFRVVLFRSYINVLLIFVPLSIIYRVLNRKSPNSVTLFCLASFATIPLIDIMQSSLNDMRRPGHTTDGSDKTVFMKLAFCFVEVLVGSLLCWLLMLTMVRLEFLLFCTTTPKFFATSSLARSYVIFSS